MRRVDGRIIHWGNVLAATWGEGNKKKNQKPSIRLRAKGHTWQEKGLPGLSTELLRPGHERQLEPPVYAPPRVSL